MRQEVSVQQNPAGHCCAYRISASFLNGKTMSHSSRSVAKCWFPEGFRLFRTSSGDLVSGRARTPYGPPVADTTRVYHGTSKWLSRQARPDAASGGRRTPVLARPASASRRPPQRWPWEAGAPRFSLARSRPQGARRRDGLGRQARPGSRSSSSSPTMGRVVAAGLPPVPWPARVRQVCNE